jgi:large subunit ribosomal protein L13
MTKTYSIKASDIERKWHVVDASDKILGRLATRIAGLLMGKHKPMFCRNLDVGDFVVVINADKVQVTGNKVMQTYPNRVIEHAVKGMLPRNKLNASMMKRLKVYSGDSHPHVGQVGSVVVDA